MTSIVCDVCKWQVCKWNPRSNFSLMTVQSNGTWCHQRIRSLQLDLTAVYQWSQKWQLKLNTSKSKVLISNSCKPTQCFYHLNNLPLEIVDSYKYLGVKITSKLSWKDHIAEVAIHQSISHLQSTETLDAWMYATTQTRAYISLVRPHLETCAPVWSPHWKGSKEQLEKVQRLWDEFVVDGQILICSLSSFSWDFKIILKSDQKTVSMDAASRGLSFKARPTNDWATTSSFYSHAAKYKR